MLSKEIQMIFKVTSHEVPPRSSSARARTQGARIAKSGRSAERLADPPSSAARTADPPSFAARSHGAKMRDLDIFVCLGGC